VTYPTSDEAGDPGREALSAGPSPQEDVGPDPVIGAGVTLLGIFLMGVGGAWDAHYLFDFGVLIAVLGAILFVLFVTVTALKQRQAREEPPAV
jgi:hypothetical protein